jgi:hypothetical protein
MQSKSLFVLLAAAFLMLGLLAACADDEPRDLYPVILQYWRPIANPNVMMDSSLAQRKLGYDLAQCRCSSYPTNVPHHEMALVAPDQGRLAETSATHVDGPGGCVISPNAVVVECMRTRGWEPTACSGRLNSAGGTQCALTVIGREVPYPQDYPYRGTRDTSFDGTASPAEQRQDYPR